MSSVQDMIDTVKAIYYPSDILTVNDLQFFIYEHYDQWISIKVLEKFYNPSVDEEDINQQFKNLGLK